MKSERNWLLSIVLIITLSVTMLFTPVGAVAVFADSNDGGTGKIQVLDTGEDGDFTYSHVNSDGEELIKITGYTGNDSVINIPDEINGHTVKAVSLEPSDAVTEINFPASVIYLNAKKLRKFRNLERIGDFENNYYRASDGVLYKVSDEGTTVACYPKMRTDDSLTMDPELCSYYTIPYENVQTLKSVTLSERLSEISCYRFECMPDLEEIIVPGNNTAYSDEDGVLFDKEKKTLLVYPRAKVDDDGIYEIPESVERVADTAFGFGTRLTKVTLPENIKCIDSAAFADFEIDEDEDIQSALAENTELREVAFSGETAPVSIRNFTGIKKAALVGINITYPENGTGYEDFLKAVRSGALDIPPADCPELAIGEETEDETRSGDQVVTYSFRTLPAGDEDEIPGEHYYQLELNRFGYDEDPGSYEDEGGMPVKIFAKDGSESDNTWCWSDSIKYKLENLSPDTEYYLQFSTIVESGYTVKISKIDIIDGETVELPDSCDEIRSGETHNVNIQNDGDRATFCFTPEQDGVYAFVSEGSHDTQGCFLNSRGVVLGYDDDYQDRNFKVIFTAKANKTYYLQAYLFSGNTGNFKVTLREDYEFEDVSGSQEYETLEPGETKSVVIDEADKTVTYKIDHTGDGVHYLTTAGDGIKMARIMRYESDEDGSYHQVWAGEGSSDDPDIDGAYYLEDGYSYYLQLRLASHDTGEFTAKLETDDGTYDYDPVPENDECIEINANETKEVNIDERNKTVTFRFTPAATSYYSLSADSYDAKYQVLSAEGEYMTGESRCEPVNFEATAGETYYLQTRFMDYSRGSYNITLTKDRYYGFDEVPSDEECIPIGLREQKNAEITEVDETATFVFRPDKDANYYFRSDVESRVNWQILNESKDYIDSGYDCNGFNTEFYGEAGKSYYLQTRYYDDETGSYPVFIDKQREYGFSELPDDSACLELGLNVNTEVEITEPDQTVTFRFVPEASGEYIFSSSSDEAVMGRIIDAYGNDQAYDYGEDDSDFRLSNNLEAGETYYFQTRLVSENTGTYNVCLRSAYPEPDDENSTLINEGEHKTVNIENADDVNTFKFTPDKDGYYVFAAVSDMLTQTRVIADGENLQTNTGGEYGCSSSYSYFYTEEGKTYYLQTRIYGDGTGSYEVSVFEPDDNFAEVDTSDCIDIALNSRETVNISDIDQTVTFRFITDTEGDYAFVSYGECDPKYRIVADGEVLDEDYSNTNNFHASFHAEADKYYYLQTRMARQHTGTFEVSVESDYPFEPISEDADYENIYAGDNKTVAIDSEDKTVTYKFTPEENGRFLIRSSGQDNKIVAITTEWGETVADNVSDEDKTEVSLQADLYEGTTYYIQTRLASHETGEYDIHLFRRTDEYAEVPDDNECAEITLNNPQTATISEIDGTVTFRFVPNKSGSYRFYSIEAPAAVKARIISDGNEITESGGFDLDSFEGDFDAKAGKTYYLQTRFVNEDTGSYDVGISRAPSDSFTEIDEEENYPEISLGQKTDAVIEEEYETATYIFRPTSSRSYTFSAEDPADSTMYRVVNGDETIISGYGWNDFSDSFYGEEGETYYLQTRYCNNSTGTIRISVAKTPSEEFGVVDYEKDYPEIALSVPNLVSIADEDDTATYTFTPSESGRYYISCPNENTKFRIEAEDSYCEFNGYYDELVAYLNEGEKYYIQTRYNDDATGSYTFTLWPVFADIPVEDEIKDIGLNETDFARSDNWHDARTYRFVPEADGTYLFHATDNADGRNAYEGRLLSRVICDGSEIARSDEYAEYLSFEGESGKTYYLQITAVNPESPEYYGVTVNKQYEEHAHVLEYVEPVEATEEHDGTRGHYRCTVYGCDKLFEDEEGSEETYPENLVVKFGIDVNDSEVRDKIELIYEKALTYNGENQWPDVTITYNGEELIQGTDYTINYPGVSREVKSYTARAYFQGKYYGNIAIRYRITCVHDEENYDGWVKEVITAPTCTKPGETSYTCNLCGYSYTETENALGHAYDNGTVTEEPTVDTAGIMTYTCTRCGRTKTEEIPALGSEFGEPEYEWSKDGEGNWQVTARRTNTSDSSIVEEETVGVYSRVATPATCNEDGETLYTSKKFTNEAFMQQRRIEKDIPADASAHEWGEWTVTAEASCAEAGNKSRTCAVCGTTENVEIPATGHTWGTRKYVWNDDHSQVTATRTCKTCKEAETETVGTVVSEVQEPTCTMEGTTTYMSEVFSNKAFHVQTSTVTVDPTGHNIELVEARDATCDETGYEAHYKCTVCNELFKDAQGHTVLSKLTETPALGHDWGEWVETKPATETENGEETRTCNNDSEHKETRVIPMLTHVHSLTATAAKAATCTQKGNKAYWTCSECSLIFADAQGTKQISLSDTVIPATGHKAGTAVREKEVAATCSAAGHYDSVVYCTVCKAEMSRETKTVAKTAHSWGEWKVTKEATETEEGVNTRVCSKCGEKETSSIAKKPATGTSDTPEVKTPEEDPEAQAAAEAKAKAEAEAKAKAEAEAKAKAEAEAKAKAEAEARAVQKGEDGTAVGAGASAEAAETAVTTMKSDDDLPGSVFSKIRLKSSKQDKKSITLSWTKVKGATKYAIYGNKCGSGNKMKKLTTSTGKTLMVKKILGKKVKKGTYYKFMIVALDKNNNVVSSSKVIHVSTKGGKTGNVKKVTIKKSVINKAKKLKKGKKLKLNAKAVAASKKLKVKKHRVITYESTNTKIATVNKKGVIKGKKKGTCYVYAYAQNGVFIKVKVRVK